MNKTKSGLAFAALLTSGITANYALPTAARADVRPANLFGDHMVLQQEKAAPVWGTARPGEKVMVSLAGKTATATADAQGKWMTRLSGLQSGGPFVLVIKGDNTVTLNDVLVGEVWLASGQSNMDFTVAKTEKKYFAGVTNEAEEIARANYPQIRYFTVDLKLASEKQNDVTGHWAVVSPATVGDMSAVGYFFARDLYNVKHVPMGVIVSTWGASTAEAWTSRDALSAVPELKPFVQSFDAKRAAYTPEVRAKSEAAQKKYEADIQAAKASGAKAPRGPRNADPEQDQHNATVLYNGMIYPVKPFGIRGFLWYQGESNGPSVGEYTHIMETLIQNWRSDWSDPNLPFLFVQLAGIKAKQTEPVAGVRGTAGMREAQRLTLHVPHTAMATAVDLADSDTPDNVHPKNKQEVGRRLVLSARALVYGEKIEYSGPLFKTAKPEGNSALRVLFTHTGGGLVGKGDGGKVTGFTVAGPDGKWAWADAKIDGDAVIVSSPSVPHPTMVRYGWADNPVLGLLNGAGLPAVPFRSDSPVPVSGAAASLELPFAAPADKDAPVVWKNALKQPAEWYGGKEAARIADNVVLYQHNNGGWIKNTDMAAPLDPAKRAAVEDDIDQTGETTIDNQTTYAQIAYLARVNAVQPKPAYQAACIKGLDFLLAAQYQNGGWPQYFPPRKGYYTHITFNDDAMMGVMNLLKAVGENAVPYRFVDSARREKAKTAVQKGIDCILKTQIVVNGTKTAWCQQHDEKTFAPAPARKFEPAALTTNETVPIVQFLMAIPRPTQAEKAAIEGAVAWLRTVQINGLRYEKKPAPGTPKNTDMVATTDPTAPPIWSRMVEIGTNKPIFMGRDSVVRYKVSDIEYERRNGYQWYGYRPAALLQKDYPAWKARMTALSTNAPTTR